MKTFLYVLSGLILFGCFFSWIRTGVHPDRPIDELLRVLAAVVAVILFCTGSVIGAIERAAKKPDAPPRSD